MRGNDTRDETRPHTTRRQTRELLQCAPFSSTVAYETQSHRRRRRAFDLWRRRRHQRDETSTPASDNDDNRLQEDDSDDISPATKSRPANGYLIL